MLFTKQLDPVLTIVLAGGIPITGFSPEGIYLTLERNEQSFEHIIGCFGEETRQKNQDESGLCTLSLLQTSLSNDLLSNYFKKDRENGQGVFSLSFFNAFSTDVVFSANAYVMNLAPITSSKDIEMRNWRIHLSKALLFTGGSVPTGISV